MSAEFEAATAVSALGEGRYAGRIQPGWDIAGNANGGYLITIAARAMADACERPPLTLTTQFLSPGRVGACEIRVEVVRAGRRTATARAVLSAGDTDVLALLGTFAEQTPGGVSYVADRPPDLPPFDECVATMPPAHENGFGDRVQVRMHPDDVGFLDGRPTGVGLIRGWFAFADAPAEQGLIDTFGLLQATDAFAPVCFNVPGVPIGWAPTLELTAHVRGIPAPGRLRCRIITRYVQDGLFEEDSEIFDSGGRLVAQSRQLALIPRPFTTG